jgi:hypothetical protein
LEQRQRLQKTLFPNGIEFDGEQFGTAASPLLFRLLGGISQDDSCLAFLTGMEPESSCNLERHSSAAGCAVRRK